MGTPYFEIYRDWRGEHRFTFRGANGEKMAQGEGYKRAVDCAHAISLLNGNGYPVRERDK